MCEQGDDVPHQCYPFHRSGWCWTCWLTVPVVPLNPYPLLMACYPCPWNRVLLHIHQDHEGCEGEGLSQHQMHCSVEATLVVGMSHCR